MKEFIVVRSDISNETIDEYAGPLEGHEELLIMDDTTRIENLWVAAGRFTSLSSAIVNGSYGQVPDGYVELENDGFHLTILNITKGTRPNRLPLKARRVTPKPIPASKPILSTSRPLRRQAPAHAERREASPESPLSYAEALRQWKEGSHVTLKSLK